MNGQAHLFEPQPPTFGSDAEADPRLVRPRQLEAFVRWATTEKKMSMDFEADGLRPWKGARPHAFGFFEPGKGAKVLDLRFLPPENRDAGFEAARDAVLCRVGVTRVHNGSFECMMTDAAFGEGAEIGGELWDNMDAAFGLRESGRPADGDFGPLTQKALAFHELRKEAVFAKAVRARLLQDFGPDEDRWRYDLLPGPLHTAYLCEDVEHCYGLGDKYEADCAREGMTELVRTDSELNRCVADMALRGLPVDFERAEVVHAEVSRAKADAARRVQDAVGRPFDLASGPKLLGLLFGELGLPSHPDIEKSGKVDEPVLKWLLTLPECDGRSRAVVQSVLDWRENHVLDDTFLLPWLYEWRDWNVIHPDLNTRRAETRRFTSAHPNLQNIPSDPRIRALVCALAGETMYSVDQSQGEYRLFAHYVNEPWLADAYRNDPTFDIHQGVADMLTAALGYPIERYPAKHLNFGILFGMGKDKLARSLLVSKARAEEILAAYYAKLPGIIDLKGGWRGGVYVKGAIEKAIKARGYLRSVLGGRRHLTADEAYKGINTLTQMGMADILRLAMVRMRRVIRRAGGWMRLQVHDEVLFSLPGRPEDHAEVLAEVNDCMENVVKLRVPLRSDCEYWTTNWAEAEPYKRAA